MTTALIHNVTTDVIFERPFTPEEEAIRMIDKQEEATRIALEAKIRADHLTAIADLDKTAEGKTILKLVGIEPSS